MGQKYRIRWKFQPLKYDERETDDKVDIACLSLAIKLLWWICYTFYLEIDTSRERDRCCVVTRNTWLESHGSPIFNFWFRKWFRRRPRSFLNVNTLFFSSFRPCICGALCERVLRFFEWQKSNFIFEIWKLFEKQDRKIGLFGFGLWVWFFSRKYHLESPFVYK